MNRLAVGMFLLVNAQARMQEDGTLKLRADTRVVQIDVTVRDSQGTPVEDLTKTDFAVTDNGKPRPFTIFSVNNLNDATPDHAAPGSPGETENSLPLPVRPVLPPGTF